MGTKRLKINFQKFLTKYKAVNSLLHVYHMKTQFSEKWKQTDFLSLVGDKQLSLPSYSVFDMTTCELIPLETLELWIYFSYILCYSAFAQSNEVLNICIQSFTGVPIRPDTPP